MGKRPTKSVPKHLHRARKNPNSTHQRVTVALKNADKGRTVKEVTLPKTPWEIKK